MKVQVASDLHLDVNELDLEDVIVPSAPVLVLGGDICEARHVDVLHSTIEWAESKFDQVFYVPGNHEYYGDTVMNGRKRLLGVTSAKTRVLFSGHEKLQLSDKWSILGATLWSYCPPEFSTRLEFSFSDFRLIKQLNARFYNILHEVDGRWLSKQLNARTPTEKTLVVTHHPPSMDRSNPSFGGTERAENWLFGSLTYNDLVYLDNIRWVYGHTHHNCHDDPVYASNQLGYGDECRDYRKDFTLDLS